jgi:hypothetical protein
MDTTPTSQSLNNNNIPKPTIFANRAKSVTKKPVKGGSPLGLARRAADKELRGLETLEEHKYLTDNPILWLRALNHLRNDVQHRTQLKRVDLLKVKPSPNATHQQQQQYVKARYRTDLENAKRAEFTRRIDRKLEEVKLFFGTERMYVLGDFINVLALIAQFADDDDINAAKDTALFYAEQWAKDYRKQ